MEKDKNKDVTKSRLGYDLLREEVTLPHGGYVTFDELIPSSWTSLWARLKSFRLSIFFTVLQVTDSIPLFFNSPRILQYPQPVSFANLRISFSMS